jgi:hypothetical protein
VKKVRAAVVIAAATTAYTKAKDYARDNPEQASTAIDKAEDFVRGKTAPKYADKIGKGSTALRKGLGLPSRATPPAPSSSSGTAGTLTASAEDEQDPDPDTDEPWRPHTPDETVAPNPAPGTSDDPQPRRGSDDPAPMTPGEHLLG